MMTGPLAPIRVLVVDDSAVSRRVISTILASDSAIQVVGEARDGREAVQLVAALQPDIITMDVRMPVMDGLQATEEIMAYHPTPILVITSSLTRHDRNLTFQMLNAGALEVWEKPTDLTLAQGEANRMRLLERVKVLSRVKVLTHLRGRRRKSPTTETNIPLLLASASPPSQRWLIVVGASTGGPRVLYKLLHSLPASIPASIIIVQHIAEGFVGTMVDWLDNHSPLTVELAQHRGNLKNGHVYVAPDTHHLRVDANWTVHLETEPDNLLYPSVDVTMQSAAKVLPKQTIGVLLTGMGRDGAQGLLALRRSGARTIAQDRATSAIWGMPRAAEEAGAAMEFLAADLIAPRLVALLSETERR